MLVALPTFAGDCHQLCRLLRWIEKLDGKLVNHDALLAFDAGTPFDAAMEAQRIAERIFREVRVFSTETSVKGWPIGPNVMFHAIAKYVQEHWPQPFLLMEPDAAPIRPGWLPTIELDYQCRETPFMGQIEPCTQPMMPERIMSGVAIYPPDTANRIPPTLASRRAWQVDAAEIMVRDGSHTPLIKDFFGQRDLPPVFVESRRPDSPAHHFTLDWLPREAVLYHRDKFGGLFPLLAKKLGIEWVEEMEKPKQNKICVVFNVHRGDIHLATRHALWLRKMNQRWPHRAVIAFDPTLASGLINQLHGLLAECFETVEIFSYPSPPIPSYPASANWAWQSCAHHMAQGTSPWLWHEADAIALTPDWLDKLQAEYEACGRSWMGSIVPHMGHCNGGAIYPADAAHRMPGAMSCGAGQAFDMQTQEVIHDTHNSRLMFHLWTLVGRMAHPVGGGELPVNVTADELRRWLPKESVFLHRIKDDSVLNALLTGAYQH